MKILDSTGRPYADTQPKPERWKRPTSSKQRTEFQYGWGWEEGEIPADKLAQEKGFVIYDEMLENDADVKNALALKKFALSSPGWEVKPAEIEGYDTQSEAKRARAEGLQSFVDHALNRMSHSFESFLHKIMDAFRQGFKVAEPTWESIPSGEFMGRWAIRRIYVRNSRWYRFKTDEVGELLRMGIVELPSDYSDPDAYITAPPPIESRELPTNRFVVYSHGATDDSGESLYGRSDLRTAYRYYYSNVELQKIRDSGIEKLIEGYRVATRDAKGNPDDDESVLSALDDLGVRLSMVLPPGFTLDMLNAAESAAGIASMLELGMERNSSSISRSMLVGDLVQSKGQVGSFALGKMHFTTFLLVVQAIARELAWTLNRQLVKPLVDLNFPDAEGLYPEIYFNASNTEDAKVKAEILQILISGGVVDKREQWVREYVGIPAMDPELQQKIEDEKEAMQAALEGGQEAPGDESSDDDNGPDGGGDKGGKRPPAVDPDQGETKQNADTAGGHLVFRRQLLAVEQKIDYAQVEVTLRRIAAASRDEVAAAIDKLFSSAHAQVRRRKIIEEKKRIDAGNLRVDATALARSIYHAQARMYVQGKADAITEINKQLALMGEEPILDERQYVDARDLAANLGIDLTEEQRRLSVAMKISDEELESFRDRAMVQAQAKARAEAEKIRAELATHLLTAIENGIPGPRAARIIDLEVKRRWLDADRQLGSGIGAIVDTAENAAYNEGRVKLYEQASSYVEALVYSAILDAGTTDFCRRHDGFIARRDDPIWSQILPPNHFRCRSIIGAVLRGETYDLSPKPAVDPSSGFDRIGFDIQSGVGRD